ncbi:MAG TPA: hypothetical protein VF815_01770 [Myxococcaceae bacterium]|jgi:hypothetical protein
MKVDRLLILCFKRGTDTEVEKGGEALYQRNMSRGLRKIELVYIHPDTGVATRQSKHKAELPTLPGEGVGVYVIGHSVSPLPGLMRKFSGISAQALAGIVANCLRPMAVKKIRKLCFAACFLAEDAGEDGFLDKFAQEFAEQGFVPKIAGWASWVSTLQPDMPLPSSRNLYDRNSGSPVKVEREEFARYQGRKAVNTSKRVVVSDAKAREEAKRFIWVKEGQVTVLSYDDWHDQ